MLGINSIDLLIWKYKIHLHWYWQRFGTSKCHWNYLFHFNCPTLHMRYSRIFSKNNYATKLQANWLLFLSNWTSVINAPSKTLYNMEWSTLSNKYTFTIAHVVIECLQNIWISYKFFFVKTLSWKFNYILNLESTFRFKIIFKSFHQRFSRNINLFFTFKNQTKEISIQENLE